MTCDGGMATLNQTTLHRQPLINQKNYAKEGAPYEAFQCFSAGDLCLGGSQLGHNQCGGGRHGLQCHACAPGWRGRKGEPCADCSETGEFSWLPICVVLAFVGLGAVYTVASGKKNSSSSKTAMLGTLSICAVNAQMFSITVSMSVGWSSQFMSYFGWMDIFALDIDGVSALSCYLGKESMQPNYLPGLLMPIFLAAMMMMLWGASRLLAKCVRRITPMKLDQSLNALGMVFMAMYIAVCKAIFNIFECRRNPSAPQTLRSHDGFLCMGDEVKAVLPAFVCGLLLYIVAFGAGYIWIIARAPAAFQNDPGFRVRSHFLLHRWHPEYWYWGIFFLLRNLLCSLVPSITPDGSKQLLLMFTLVLPLFIAQVRVWPWRDELANMHDLIMVAALLIIIVLGLALQVPVAGMSLWFSLLQIASSLTFIVAVGFCLLVLAQALLTELRIQKKQRQHSCIENGGESNSFPLPNLMMQDGSGKNTPTNSETVTSVTTCSSGSRSMSKRVSRSGPESSDDKICDIYKTLNLLSTAGDSNLLELVKEMGEELPSADLKKLQWGMGVIGYHVLGDMSKRPVGIVLNPVASRSCQFDEASVSV